MVRNIYKGGNKPFTLEILKNKLKESSLLYECVSSEYINARTKLDFKCLRCDRVFNTTPDNILRGHGCPYCAKIVSATEDEIRQKIGDRYIIKSLQFKNNSDTVLLSCKEHGDFRIPVRRILKDCGCQKCAALRAQTNQRKTTQQFLGEIQWRNYDEVYDFSKTVYVNAKTKITVICKKCGKEFSKDPRLFYHGTMKACPYCNYYAGEEIIKNILQENKIDYIWQYSFKESEISRLSFDFYLPGLNTVIEYQGMQHYKAVRCWGGEKRLKQQQTNDQRKRDYCKKNGIKEIEVSYKESPLTVLKESGIIP